jgi:hypothetical protein
MTLWVAILTSKRTRRLVSGTKSIIATTPSGWPWRDKVMTIEAGSTNVLGLWDSFFQYPVLLYSFPDGQRFLCVYDDDTAVLVFVVDCRTPETNAASQTLWPPNDYTRDYLARATTNVVIQSAGIVRLPSYDEVREVSHTISAWTPRQFKACCFPVNDIGVFWFYFPKDFVLMALDTNRQSCWPAK